MFNLAELFNLKTDLVKHFCSMKKIEIPKKQNLPKKKPLTNQLFSQLQKISHIFLFSKYSFFL